MQKIDGSILIVDDDAFILDTAKLYLKQEVDQVLTADDPERIPEIIDAHEIDVVLLDMNYRKGDMDGKDGIRWLTKQEQDIPPNPFVRMHQLKDRTVALYDRLTGH